MEEAAARLEVLVARHPEQLPRYRSSKSGRIFARIVDSENQNLLRSRSYHVRVRAGWTLKYLKSYGTLIRLYTNAAATQKVGGEDLFEIERACLHFAPVLTALADELGRTLSPYEPNYQVRKDGLRKMQAGQALLVAGTIQSLQDHRPFSVATRLRLLESCRETFPIVVPRLSATQQKEILQRLDKLATDPKFSELEPELSSLRDAVRSACLPSTSPAPGSPTDG